MKNKDRLVKCKCSALFDPAIQWARGYNPDGRNSTSNRFTATSLIPLGNCPICLRTPEQQV